MNEAEFTRAIETLRDLSRTDVDRRAALDALRQAEFEDVGGTFPRASYLAALRDLIEDRDDEVRRVAIVTLAEEKDPFMQGRLLDGLLGVAPAIVPAARAIQLLSYDSHGPHVPSCRTFAADPSLDEGVRIEALRALGGDPASQGQLQRLMIDRDESLAIRSWAGVSLRALAPRAFARLADAIRKDDSDDRTLRQMYDVAFRTSPTLANLL
jgi:hypothetical protein